MTYGTCPHCANATYEMAAATPGHDLMTSDAPATLCVECDTTPLAGAAALLVPFEWMVAVAGLTD